MGIKHYSNWSLESNQKDSIIKITEINPKQIIKKKTKSKYC
jgi:hypothetical protein